MYTHTAHQEQLCDLGWQVWVRKGALNVRLAWNRAATPSSQKKKLASVRKITQIADKKALTKI